MSLQQKSITPLHFWPEKWCGNASIPLKEPVSTDAGSPSIKKVAYKGYAR